MNGLTNYITERPWIDIVTTWFVLVDDAYRRFIAKLGRRLRTSGTEPSFTDSKVLTVSLILETFFQGDEEVGYVLDIIGNNVARLFQAAECGLESPRHNRE